MFRRCNPEQARCLRSQPLYEFPIRKRGAFIDPPDPSIHHSPLALHSTDREPPDKLTLGREKSQNHRNHDEHFARHAGGNIALVSPLHFTRGELGP
jgi:hypothetical protein